MNKLEQLDNQDNQKPTLLTSMFFIIPTIIIYLYIEMSCLGCPVSVTY